MTNPGEFTGQNREALRSDIENILDDIPYTYRATFKDESNPDLSFEDWDPIFAMGGGLDHLREIHPGIPEDIPESDVFEAIEFGEEMAEDDPEFEIPSKFLTQIVKPFNSRHRELTIKPDDQWAAFVVAEQSYEGTIFLDGVRYDFTHDQPVYSVFSTYPTEEGFIMTRNSIRILFAPHLCTVTLEEGDERRPIEGAPVYDPNLDAESNLRNVLDAIKPYVAK